MSVSSTERVSNKDAQERSGHFKCISYIYECGKKLQLKSIALATCAALYHSFFEQCRLSDYDPYLIATTSLYLAGKIEEQHVKLRDVINVAHRTLHPSEPPLDIGEPYYLMRDSVVNCELLMMRMLKFDVVYDHPHKYLLYYLSSLRDWIGPEFDSTPVARTAWSLVRDIYHSAALCLHSSPQLLAVAACQLSLHCHGLRVPHDDQAGTNWHTALYEDATPAAVEAIIQEMTGIYQWE